MHTMSLLGDFASLECLKLVLLLLQRIKQQFMSCCCRGRICSVLVLINLYALVVTLLCSVSQHQLHAVSTTLLNKFYACLSGEEQMQSVKMGLSSSVRC